MYRPTIEEVSVLVLSTISITLSLGAAVAVSLGIEVAPLYYSLLGTSIGALAGIAKSK